MRVRRWLRWLWLPRDEVFPAQYTYDHGRLVLLLGVLVPFFAIHDGWKLADIPLSLGSIALGIESIWYSQRASRRYRERLAKREAERHG